MDKLKSLIVVLLLVGSALPNVAKAQHSEAEQIFEEGVIQYRNRNYEQAQLRFMELLSAPEPNKLLSAGLLMMAKTADKLNRPTDAIEYADRLLDEFPASRYQADAYFVKAAANYMLGEAEKTLQNLVLAIDHSQSPALSQKCELYATQLVQQGEVGFTDLKRIYNSNKLKKAEPLYLLWLTRSALQKGNKTERDFYADLFLQRYPRHRFVDAAKRLKATLVNRNVSSVKIGVLLPMSGLFSSEATDLLRGMIFSLKNRKSQSPKIEIVLKDTKGSDAETVKAALSLLHSDINLMVGELESSKSSAVAGVAARSGIPLIIPVATENGLWTIGSAIFQMNNDVETRGIKLARYAYNTLGLKTLASLAPADEYGHSLTDAFMNEFDHLGGTVISQQWYYPGTQDFKRQFDAIREAGIRYALRDSIALMGLQVTPQRIDSLFRAIDRQVKRNSEDFTGVVESYDIPVTTIDGLFMPTYEEDIEIVAPQFALSNIAARPLGGDYWNNGELLRKQRNYLNNAVFISGNYVSETNVAYKDFVNKFRMDTAASPGTMALYGYNIMNLLIEAVDNGNTEAEEIVSYLEGIKNYQGLGGRFSFDSPFHVNQSVNILQFVDGNIYDVFSEEFQIMMQEEEEKGSQ